MSSYFFGGFSAYWIEPSGRRLNHSGCSVQPGMVGRALDGEIERDFHAVRRRRPRPAGGNRRACRARDARHRGRRLPSRSRRGCRDRPGSARKRIVAALAVGVPDRMDRREIEHVEAQRRDLRQPRDAIVEGAVPAGNAALAARHHLVPGAGARERPVGDRAEQSGLRVRSDCSAPCAAAASNSSDSSGAASSLASHSRQASLMTNASALLARLQRRQGSAGLPASPASTSWPASRLARKSRRQVAKTSVQASMA